FCSEMDGIDSLNDVVIILASNRADLIDPAILPPGRIDRKIKVSRPDKEDARDIYRIYLTDDLPYDGVLAKEADGLDASIERLIERFVDSQLTLSTWRTIFFRPLTSPKIGSSSSITIRRTLSKFRLLDRFPTRERVQPLA